MRQPIPILLYHRFGTDTASLYSRPEVFEQQLAWLKAHGYRSLELDEFDRLMEDGDRQVEGRPVLITFDDGYLELEDVVAPLLARYGFTGVAFLITNEMGGNHITWEQARRLASSGIIEFQSHSHEHVHWETKSDPQRALTDDLSHSLDLLETELRLPRSYFRHLAWPWGHCNADWERIGKDLGQRYQHIVQKGAVTRAEDRMRLPRICVDGISLDAFSRWMRLLSNGMTARVCNRVFGTIHQRRHGVGYV